MGFFENLFESVSKPFLKTKPTEANTIDVKDPNIDSVLTQQNDGTDYVIGFFDDGENPMLSDNNERDIVDVVRRQNDAIISYRKASQYTEVSAAIDEIVNELCFNYMSEEIVSLNFKDDYELSDNLKEALLGLFEEIKILIDIDENLDDIVRRFYIDGQVILGVSYKNKKEKEGIKTIYTLSPLNFYYDNKDKKFKYISSKSGTSTTMAMNMGTSSDVEVTQIYDIEEIVRVDSGLYHDGIILSDLQNIVKTVNQITGLEDLMTIMRFSRSMSRRVFNIDVGNLPYNKAIEKVDQIKEKFKYRKFYDTDKGTINNSASVQSIVEDYYFPNRSGSKGTTVDVLDESGNLGETGDLDYFNAKLLNSLKVPSSRLIGDNKTMFDFSSTSIENAEIKFFAFIQRKRKKLNKMFLELMRRQAVSKQILTTEEFDMYSKMFSFSWSNANAFLERQKQAILKERIETYDSFKEYEGDIYPREWLLKNVLKLTDEEIEQFRDDILREGHDNTEADEDIPSEMEDEELDDFGEPIIGNKDKEEEIEDEEPEEEINASKENDIEDLKNIEIDNTSKSISKEVKRAEKGLSLIMANPEKFPNAVRGRKASSVLNVETLKPIPIGNNDGFNKVKIANKGEIK